MIGLVRMKMMQLRMFSLPDNERERTMTRWPLSAAIILLIASLASADGDGPTRQMTSAETAAYESVRKTVRDAVPSALPGYTVSVSGSEQSAQIPEALPAGRMHRMAFTIKYTLTKEEEQKQAVAALMESTRGTPQQQEQLAAIRAREEELKKARDRTRDRGEKDRLRAEIKTVQQEENRVLDEIAAAQMTQAASGGSAAMKSPADAISARVLSAEFRVNQTFRVSNRAKPYPIAGFPTAFEQGEDCPDASSYCITVLIGPFTKGRLAGRSTEYTLSDSVPGPSTRPRGLALIVSGAKNKPEAVRELLQKTNLGLLKGMLP
jgi:hypothetical protein